MLYVMKLKHITVSVFFAVFLLVNIGGVPANACTPKQSEFGIPTWYKYLQGDTVSIKPGPNSAVDICRPKMYTTTEAKIKDDPEAAGADLSKNITAIGLAFVEIILRLLIYLAIAWGIWGGYQIIASSGNAQSFKSGVDRVKNAAIGLLIGILATPLITFVAEKIIS